MPGLAAILAGHHGAPRHLEPARRRPRDIGLIKVPSFAEPLVLPSVAAAVIGIFGGRGGYTGTGALTILQMPEGVDIVRADCAVVTVAYLRIVEER